MVQGVTAARDDRRVEKPAEQASFALKFAKNNWTDSFSRIKLGPMVRVAFIYPQGNGQGFDVFACVWLGASGREPAECCFPKTQRSRTIPEKR